MRIADTHSSNNAVIPQMKPDCTVFFAQQPGTTIAMKSNAISFVELKKGDGHLVDSDKGQIIDDLIRFLGERRSRSVVYGLLCNCAVGHVFKVTRKHTSYNLFKIHESAELRFDNKEQCGQLLFPIFGDMMALGYTTLELESGKKAGEFLGTGASSIVYECYGDDMVLKWFNDQEEYAEAKKVHELLVEVEDGIRCCRMEESDDAKQCLVLSPLAQKSRKKDFSKENVIGLFETILKVNQATGLVHRDLRRPNILVKNEELYIGDWAYAIKEDDEVGGYKGTLQTASNQVLKDLAFPLIPHVTCRDDLESIGKMIWMIHGVEDESFESKIGKGKDYSEILTAWEKEEQEHEDLREMLAHCRGWNGEEQDGDIEEWLGKLQGLLTWMDDEMTIGRSSSSSS
eukprot:TRINITY_DN102_c0_g2_i9.p1 TRINITY_DN102_c0_g2~~TRINITY_DN102_c0_g2_i9.p1  ORF type:complete len:400 (+),score=126.68 TRINITY_DN102_c0_g2_i9:366-1565(+)